MHRSHDGPTGMPDESPDRSSRTSRIIAAPREAVCTAFIDRDLLLAWLPPAGMTGRFHRFDARVGGGYRMSLYYPETERTFRGKAADNEDVVDVRFVELAPPRRIVEAIRFVSDDAAFAGEMTLIVTIEEAAGGSEVTLEFSDIPHGIRPEDNDAGARSSLENLARLLER